MIIMIGNDISDFVDKKIKDMLERFTITGSLTIDRISYTIVSEENKEPYIARNGSEISIDNLYREIKHYLYVETVDLLERKHNSNHLYRTFEFEITAYEADNKVNDYGSLKSACMDSLNYLVDQGSIYVGSDLYKMTPSGCISYEGMIFETTLFIKALINSIHKTYIFDKKFYEIRGKILSYINDPNIIK